MKEFETVVVQPKQTHNGVRFAEELVKVEFVGTELVRCKDCAYWQDELCSFRPDWHYCAMNNTDFRANEYCSRGERKDKVEE